MTPNEFKAWFDGFTEAFEGRIPTKAQWGRIKERVAEIDGKPVTERIYLDRYWPTYVQPSIKTYPVWSNGVGVGATTYKANAVGGGLSQNANNQYAGTAAGSFNSSNAMLGLGRAEAKTLS